MDGGAGGEIFGNVLCFVSSRPLAKVRVSQRNLGILGRKERGQIEKRLCRNSGVAMWPTGGYAEVAWPEISTLS
jgi:hypothetical protein